MNRYYCAILIFLISTTSESQLFGQCSQLQAQLKSCGGPNNCQQQVPINVPLPSQYGFYVGYFQVYCCSTYFDTAIEDGGCQGTQLYPPIRKDQLAVLASRQPILIANCGGGYDPYRQMPEDDSIKIKDSLAGHLQTSLK